MREYVKRLLPWEQRIIYGLIILLTGYIIVRAQKVPFTIDEAITYFQFVSQGIWIPEKITWNANNHILNTLLTMWSEELFGSTELALRLPNVLGGFLYLTYAGLWAKKVKKPFNALTLFVGLTTGQFLLDFFGLCRGYGLSMAFLLVSWYHLTAWWRTFGMGHLLVALVAGSLAVASNLSLIVPQLVAIGAMAMGCITYGSVGWMKRLGGLVMVGMIGALPLTKFAAFAFILKDEGHLFYGAGEGFWSVTVGSLVEAAFTPWEGFVVYVLPLGLSISFVVALLLWLRSNTVFWKTGLVVMLVLLIGCVMGQLLLHEFYEVNFPQDRVGLFYIPLVVLLIVSTYEENSDSMIAKMMLVPLGLVWMLPLNMLHTFNISYSRIWPWEAGSRQFFDHIVDSKDSLGFVPVVAGGTLQTYSYDYYNMLRGRPLHSMQDHISGSDIPDFQYTFPEGSGSWWRFDTVDVDVLKVRALLARKPLRPRKNLSTSVVEPMETDFEFINLAAISLDTIPNADLLFEFEMSIQTESLPLKAWVVLDVADSIGNRILYETIKLEHFTSSLMRHDGRLADAFVYPGSFVKGANAMVYLWNIKKVRLSVGRATTKVCQRE